MKNFNYILTNEKLTIISDGKQYSVCKNDKIFDKCVQLLKKDEYDEIIEILDISKSIDKVFDLKDDELYFNNKKVNNKIIKKIIEFRDNGLNYEPLMKFVENQLLNPDNSKIIDLYDFIEHGNMPITKDGCFIAYKVVNENYKDKYSGFFDNHIGKICEMDRKECDSNRNHTCSTGLHVCTYDYIDGYKNNIRDKIMIVKVNPKDVISVPYDYNCAKMRCCKYEVIDEYIDREIDPILYDENDKIEINQTYESPCYINDDIRKGNKFIVTDFNDEAVFCRKLKGAKIIKIDINKWKQLFC